MLPPQGGNRGLSYSDPFGLECTETDTGKPCPKGFFGRLIERAAANVAQFARDVRGMSREELKQAGRDAAHLFNAMAGGTLGGSGRTTGTPPVSVGTTVYRVYGGESRQMGTYWTTVNPNATRNFAAGAGLPTQNQMTSVVQGRITDMSGVRVTSAAPGAHGPGGLPEVQIPNAAQQVEVTGVHPFNPIP